MQERKKRVGFVTSSILIKTGFSNNARALIPYLYKTGKYEIFHLNQGIGDDPNLQRFPWHNEGVYRKGTFDEYRHNLPQEEGYRRHVSYGNLAIEDFIIRNKLDVVIHQEDIWSSSEESYIKSKWWKYLKNNFLQHSTADSLPVLPSFKAWAKVCPNIWLWGSFAVRALHQENKKKYGHVRHQFGTLNIEEYNPISQEEKLKLRKEFGISPQTKLFIFLGRNQLRKLFPATLESLAKYKQLYPRDDVKLLFHCCWSEGIGWPLGRLIEELGLKKDDVLTTYYCRSCGKWEVKAFKGEDQDCRYCGAKGAPASPQMPGGSGQATAGVLSTVTNRDLAKIYGICDASLSIFTSGGMEYTNPQSLLCELPLLCSNYSCGEDFTCKDFIYRLDGNFTYEVGTGFKKHVPNQDTIVRFFKVIYDMPEEQRKEIGRIGRKWALETFDIKNIGPIFEKWIDSREPHNWDFKYQEELKDPHAHILHIEDESDWIKQLYSKILKMEVEDDDSGLKSWLVNLQKGQPRQQILDFFRKVAWEENAKLTQKPIDFMEILEPSGRKRFLLVVKESAGDILYATSLLASLKEQYPSTDIYFACDPQYFPILEGNLNIYKMLPYQSFMDSEIFCTGRGNDKGYFDYYSNLTILSQKILNYLTHHKIGLKIRKE